MKRTIWFGAAAAVWVASTATLAQPTPRAPAYHLKDEVELNGRVSSLETIPDWMGRDGVNLKVMSPGGMVVASHVDVATASFLKMLDFQLAVGDDIKLRGSWGAAADGTRVFLVHELTSRKVSLFVRDPAGVPLW